MLHLWHNYLHVGYFTGKCRWIYCTMYGALGIVLTIMIRVYQCELWMVLWMLINYQPYTWGHLGSWVETTCETWSFASWSQEIDGEREGKDRGPFRLLKVISIMLRSPGDAVNGGDVQPRWRHMERGAWVLRRFISAIILPAIRALRKLETTNWHPIAPLVSDSRYHEPVPAVIEMSLMSNHYYQHLSTIIMNNHTNYPSSPLSLNHQFLTAINHHFQALLFNHHQSSLRWLILINHHY